MDKELSREIIIDNYQHPYHKGLKEDDTYYMANTNNESCIDNIDIQLKIENGKIIDANFDGEACAISTSATSIFMRKLIGKTIDEVKKILENYTAMINEEPYDKNILEELLAYDQIYLQPNRKKCALLPKDTIDKIFSQLTSLKEVS